MIWCCYITEQVLKCISKTMKHLKVSSRKANKKQEKRAEDTTWGKMTTVQLLCSLVLTSDCFVDTAAILRSRRLFYWSYIFWLWSRFGNTLVYTFHGLLFFLFHCDPHEFIDLGSWKKSTYWKINTLYKLPPVWSSCTFTVTFGAEKSRKLAWLSSPGMSPVNLCC